MTKKFTIRPATLHDINELITLEHECFTSDRISRQSLRRLLKKKPVPIFIALLNQKIIGAIIIFFRKNSDQARIYSLAVSPRYRKLGVAIALHAAAEKNILARQCHTVILEVSQENLSAISFYKKHHYETFGLYNHYYEDKTHALRMKKKLIWK